MPTPRPRLRSSSVATRARYARTSGDMLVGGFDPSDGIDPGSQPPIWWMGLDSGGGSYPIGPNGPYVTHGPGMSVVTRATALITGPLTSAPFRVLEAGYGGQPLARPRWVMDPMLLRPDSRFASAVYPDVIELPRSTFWTEWIRNAIHWGVGAFLTQLDESGQPLAGTLRNLNSAMLSTERDANGTLCWVLGADGADTKAVFSRDGYLSLGPVLYRIVTLRNPHSPVDIDGHSKGVFELNPEAFKLGSQITSFESGTFRSGIPAGYLKVDQTMNSMTQEQADALKQKWMASHGGDRRSIAVLNAFTSFVPLNLSPVDAALGEAKRLNIGDVAYAFGLDPLTLGVSMGNSATYNNLRDAWLNHKDFGLAPWIGAVQDTLSALLPGQQSVAVNLDGFANPPASERYASYQVAIDAGILTVEEVRAIEGLPELPPSAESSAETRNLSAAEVSQKVYLAVQAGVLSIPEARQMIADAGGKLVVDDIPEPAELEPTGTTDIRSRRPTALR